MFPRSIYVILWRKGNSRALLVESQTGVATLGNSVEFPQKQLKMEPPYEPVISSLGIYPKNPETLIQKNL